MKTQMKETAMNPAPAKTERPRSTQLRKAASRNSLITLLGVLITSGLEAAAAPALDGEGVMTVSPASVAYGSAGNTFTFSLGQQNLWVDSGSGSFPNV
jgi:hypothetical protein